MDPLATAPFCYSTAQSIAAMRVRCASMISVRSANAPSQGMPTHGITQKHKRKTTL
jgi:hypothetical protein